MLHVQDNLHLQVMNFSESAVGIGLFRMVDQPARELLISQNPIPFGNGRMLLFVRHDEGDNSRATVYSRLGWLMLLNLPMDYHNDDFIREMVTEFGKLHSWWREDVSPVRTLIRCAYGAARDIPRSIVIREP